MPIHSNPKELANDFSSFFANKVDQIRKDFSANNEDTFKYDAAEEDSGDINTLTAFRKLSCDEVQRIIMKAASKQCELDPLPTFLVKECITELSPIITNVVNISLTNAEFPTKYKRAVIKPLLKKPGLEPIHKNYRPVSNLTFVSKIIEEAASVQIEQHITNHSMHEKFQSAYKAKHSTETALVRVFDNVLKELDRDNVVYLALLDLTAAFDTVDHEVLLQRLKRTFKITGQALKWICSYLSDRSAVVLVNGQFSDPSALECSVPQGSKVGPRMYNEYTFPLEKLITMMLILYHLYADDSQLQKSFNPRVKGQDIQAANHLEQCICEVSKWMKNNKLRLNRDKTEFIILASTSNAKRVSVNSLDLQGETVNAAPVVRNLGVHIDSTFSLEKHIGYVQKVCYYYLNWIRKIRHYLSKDTAKSLVHALVISRIDYCNSLYVGLPKSLTDRLQRIMRAAAKLVALPHNRASVSGVCKQLHWLPVRERAQFKMLCLVYKSLHDSAPDYLKDLLVPYQPGRNLRSTNTLLLRTNKCRVKYGERAFSKRGTLSVECLASRHKSFSKHFCL